ncbi:MAG: GAF domain-containing protein [Thermoplasmatota archaeon]
MEDRKAVFDDLGDQIGIILGSDLDRDRKLQDICELLEREVPHYGWVGFYLVDPDADDELMLGPYVGAPTDHLRIPFGEGICGRVADTLETLVIQDVSKETNYLSCSPFVKSEVVIPIFRGSEFVGELDIDSHDLGPFTDEDREFLEEICELISDLF